MSNIYDETYVGSEAQKEAISYYLSEVQMSNPDCEAAIYALTQQRQNQFGSKAGTLGYVFSSGHPNLITTFTNHVVNTLAGKDTPAGKLYLWTPDYVGANTVFTASKTQWGIWLDCNCKRWHVDRHIVSLYEVLELYKWAHGGPLIHWLSPRERKDGRFAFKAFLTPSTEPGSLWTKRKAPGPPNEYAVMMKQLI
jgi:hypothetical protein